MPAADKKARKKKRSQKIHLVILFGIILLSIFLRFYDLNTTPGLDFDSAAYAGRVRNILNGLETPSVGFQIYFGPIFLYWLASFSFIFGLSVFTLRSFLSIVGVLTVAVSYLVGKSYFNRNVGLIFALLVAVSVWQVVQSRLIWEIDTLPLYALIILYLLKKSLQKKELVVFIGLLLGIAFQIHNTGIMLVPVVVSFYIFFNKKVIISKYAAFALIAFLVAYFPVIYFNITNNFTTLYYYRSLFDTNSRNGDFVSKISTALSLMKENLSGPWRFTNPVSQDLFANNLLNVPIFFIAWILGVFLLLIQTLKEKSRMLGFLLFSNIIVFFGIPLLANGLYTHYFTLMMPFSFLSIAFIFGFLIKGRVSGIIVLSLILLLAIQNLNYLQKDYFQFFYSTGGTGYYETHRCCKDEVASFIRQNTDNSTTILFEDDLNLFEPVHFYVPDYSFGVLKSCDPSVFVSATKTAYVFNYDSPCDRNFKEFFLNSHQVLKEETIKSPSGEASVYSVYIVAPPPKVTP